MKGFSPVQGSLCQKASQEELTEAPGLSSALCFLSDHSRAFESGAFLKGSCLLLGEQAVERGTALQEGAGWLIRG